MLIAPLSIQSNLAQLFLCSDPWSIVSLAFFLRYPNPYASHVVSCDVISRNPTPQGTLLTTRLILKRGALPKWAPRGIVSRAESWVIEESEVDPFGKVVRCRTKNLDHVKVMQVEETTELREVGYGYVAFRSLFVFYVNNSLQPNYSDNSSSFHLRIWLGLDKKN